MNHRGRINLLLTDVVMPDMSGCDLALEFLRRYPAARVLLMSGYTDDDVVQQQILAGTAAFIQKPFTPAALLQKLRNTLGGSDAP